MQREFEVLSVMGVRFERGVLEGRYGFAEPIERGRLAACLLRWADIWQLIGLWRFVRLVLWWLVRSNILFEVLSGIIRSDKIKFRDS